MKSKIMLFSEYRIEQALFLQAQLQDDKVKKGQDTTLILFWYDNYLQICGVPDIERLKAKIFEVMDKVNPLFDKFDEETFLNINEKLEIFCNEYQLETFAVYISKENIGVIYIELESARLNLIMIDIILIFMTHHFGFKFYPEEGK